MCQFTNHPITNNNMSNKLILKEFLAGFRNFGKDVKTRGIPKFHFTKTEWEDFSRSGPGNGRALSLSLLWRGMYMIAFLGIFIDSASTKKDYKYIFLTQWSLLTQTLYSIVFFGYNVMHCVGQYKGRRRTGLSSSSNDPENQYESQPGPSSDRLEMGLETVPKSDTPATVHDENEIEQFLFKSKSRTNICLESVIWILFNIVFTLSMVVTIVFWSDLLSSKSKMKSKYVLTHGCNAIFAVIDVMLVSLPVRVTHFIYPAAFLTSYISFSALYDIGGGGYPMVDKPYIYSYLNWSEKPYRTLFSSFGSLFVVFGFHWCILWPLYNLRLFLVSRFSGRADKARAYDYHSCPYNSSASRL